MPNSLTIMHRTPRPVFLHSSPIKVIIPPLAARMMHQTRDICLFEGYISKHDTPFPYKIVSGAGWAHHTWDGAYWGIPCTPATCSLPYSHLPLNVVPNGNLIIDQCFISTQPAAQWAHALLVISCSYLAYGHRPLLRRLGCYQAHAAHHCVQRTRHF